MTNYFDTDVAAEYDDPRDPMFSAAVLAETVDALAELADDGPALEFAIGTGRVALPLARAGVPVTGIEYSPAMLDVLRAKPSAETITAVVGDMAGTRVEGEFSLVYLVFNTIGNLTTQQAQVDCFANAAAHLRPGGRFVIELGVPSLQRLPRGERFLVFAQTADHTGVDEYDVVTQGLISHHFTRRPDGSHRLRSMPFRYAWPAELDLMARLAGLRLEHRWADWDRSPFTATSEKHVSVWRDFRTSRTS
jgi:SAM-dependent methyltransferase